MSDDERLEFGWFLWNLNEEGIYPAETANLAVREYSKRREYKIPDKAERRSETKGEARKKA